MRVIIIGRGNMLANLIRGCMLSKVDIVGVLRYENLYLSKFDLLLHDLFKSSPDLTLIKKHKLYDIKCKSANSAQFKNEILKLNADILLVGTWAEKLSNDVINMPAIGSINVHPSLLPKYRGPNPYLQTILHQEKYSGVTFHLMNDKLDAGGILAQDKIEILPVDTGKELREKTIFRARLLCARLMEKLKNGCIEPTEQIEADASYYKDVSPEDMTLDFYKETAEEIYARIRAFHPFKPTYIQIGKKFYIVNPYTCKITEATGNPYEIVAKGKNKLIVACKDGKCIEFNDLKKYRKFL